MVVIGHNLDSRDYDRLPSDKLFRSEESAKSYLVETYNWACEKFNSDRRNLREDLKYAILFDNHPPCAGYDFETFEFKIKIVEFTLND